MLRRIKQAINQILNDSDAITALERAVKRSTKEISTVKKQLDSLSHEISSIPRTQTQVSKPTISTLSIAQIISRARNKKSLLVAGFFGAFNLGDELMLETLLDYLRKYYPHTDVTIMLTDNYQCDISRYGNYHFIHTPNTSLDINAVAESFDAVIFPGGALIDDSDFGLNHAQLSLSTILTILSLRFTAMNKPCILYGLSSNVTLTNQDFIRKINKLASSASHFSLRDTNSLKTLEKLDVATQDIEIVDDIIIANPNILSKSDPDTHCIGLIYIYTENTLPELVTLTKLLLASTPKTTKLRLIPFYDYNNNDVVFAKQLIDKVGDNRLSLDNEVLGDFKETVASISTKGTVISMRYHGTLLANILGTRVLCINYDTHPHYPNKNSHIYSYYDFNKHMIDFSEIHTITSEKLQNILQSTTTPPDIRSIHTRASDKLRKTLKEVL